MPTSLPPLEFFLDRGLGRYVVASALRDAGMIVHTMADVFGDREQSVADEEWLADAGERGWIVLAKDKKISRRPAEIEAIARNRVCAFVISSGNLTGAQQAGRILANRDKIEAIARESRAVVCALDEGRVRRIWPKGAT